MDDFVFLFLLLPQGFLLGSVLGLLLEPQVLSSGPEDLFSLRNCLVNNFIEHVVGNKMCSLGAKGLLTVIKETVKAMGTCIRDGILEILANGLS